MPLSMRFRLHPLLNPVSAISFFLTLTFLFTLSACTSPSRTTPPDLADATIVDIGADESNFRFEWSNTDLSGQVDMVDSNGNTITLTPERRLLLSEGSSVRLSGAMFVGATEAEVWIFSTPRLLDKIQIKENGFFTAQIDRREKDLPGDPVVEKKILFIFDATNYSLKFTIKMRFTSFLTKMAAIAALLAISSSVCHASRAPFAPARALGSPTKKNIPDSVAALSTESSTVVTLPAGGGGADDGSSAYSTAMQIYFALFGILPLINMDLAFGPNSVLGMKYFTSSFDALSDFFARCTGLAFAMIAAEPKFFGVPTAAFVKKTLVFHALSLPLFLKAAMAGGSFNSSMWYIQAITNVVLFLWGYGEMNK